MSLVYLDCCGDFYSTAELSKRWDVVSGTPTVGPTIGRRDGGGILLSATSARLEKQYPALATMVAGIAFKLDSMVATDLLTFREGSINHVVIRVTNTGAIEVLNGDGTQLAISSAGLVFAGFYSYLEATVTISNASGVVTVDLNSTNIHTLTSEDTQNGGTAVTDNIEIEGSPGNLTIDDFYVLDTTGSAPQNTRLGDTAVWGILPQGDGTTNSFGTLKPSSPTTSFDKVDDPTPDDDATYVASGVALALELFDMADLPVPGGVSAIHGVQLNHLSRKDGITARIFTPKVRSGGTNYSGASAPLTTSYLYYRELWDDDPDTGPSLWTEAGVNAAEFGVEVV